MPEKIICQGAEALLIMQDNLMIKKRIRKGYRIKEIDEKLRKLRTRAEAKIMEKLQGKINVPKILAVNEQKKEIVMQFIEGKKLSLLLDNFPLKTQLEICGKIGKETAKIHNQNIIHSDLTTSNMILKEVDCQGTLVPYIFLIDFGLSFHSARIEDKAVDLHLFKQALESRHFKNWKILFGKFLSDYDAKDKGKILQQLKKVEARGRYKSF